MLLVTIALSILVLAAALALLGWRQRAAVESAADQAIYATEQVFAFDVRARSERGKLEDDAAGIARSLAVSGALELLGPWHRWLLRARSLRLDLGPWLAPFIEARLGKLKQQGAISSSYAAWSTRNPHVEALATQLAETLALVQGALPGRASCGIRHELN